MNYRERLLSVYNGETPDVIPFMLDLSHWFYERTKKPWNLSATYDEPEQDLIEYHKKADVGFYVANLASFFTVAGDQVPPGADEDRIKIMRDMVEKHGRY